MDYVSYPLSGRFYSGAEQKVGIYIGGQPYIVKFAKNSSVGMTYNHVSEFLGSHIFAVLGIQTQETMLGTYAGHPVVVMKDFIGENETFVPFNDVGDSSLERDREIYRYSYDDICRMLNENKKLTNVEETVDRFWDMYVIDALIGNFDRHGANWGFLKYDNRYRMAPVFDNGSSLFLRLNSDDKLLEVLNSEEEMKRRVFEFPTSQIQLNGRKSSYYSVINSLQFLECNEAIMRICPRVDMNKICALIHSVQGLSEVRKEFYCRILQYRFEELLLRPYHVLQSAKKEWK